VHATLKGHEQVLDYKFVPDINQFFDKLLPREMGRLSSNTFPEDWAIRKKVGPIIKQINKSANGK